MLKVTKQRHSVVVPNMARACRAMRQKYQLGMEEVALSDEAQRLPVIEKVCSIFKQ